MNDKDLEPYSFMAAKYAEAYLANDRKQIKTIAAGVEHYDAIEMAFFCQQVVSHFEHADHASLCLTVLTNQLMRP